MNSDINKVSLFKQSVSQETDLKIKQLEEDINIYKEQTIQQATNKTYEEIFSSMQLQVQKIKAIYLKDQTHFSLQCKRKLIIYRNELTEKIFQQLHQQLILFTQTTHYLTFLQAQLQEFRKIFPFEKVIISIRPADQHLTAQLLSEVAGVSVATIEPDPQISLGGFLLWDERRYVMLDQTLESQLKEVKKQFLINCELALH